MKTSEKVIISLMVLFVIADFSAVGAWVFYTSSPEPTVQLSAEQSAEVREANLQYNANEVAGGIEYIKDPRTNLCFAFYWSRGPALTVVPEKDIPQELIRVADVDKMKAERD